MSYDAIEGAFLTLLQALTGTFATSAQVTRGDWRIVDSGLSPLAVLYPGPFSEGDTWASGGTDYQWTVNCQLITRFLNNGTSQVSMEQTRDAVVAQIQKYPTLNALAGVQAVGRVNGGEIVELRDKDGGGPYFLQTDLTWQVTELVTVTGGEIP